MRQAQINVRTRACSRTSIARTKQAALTHNVRGKELKLGVIKMLHNAMGYLMGVTVSEKKCYKCSTLLAL